MKPRRLLVPLDGSGPSETALRHALELARWTRAGIGGLHVVDRVLLDAYLLGDLAGMIGVAPVTTLRSGMRKVLRGRGEGLLSWAERECRRAKVRFSGRMREDRVAPAILSAARAADIVVMGRSGAGRHVPLGRHLSAVLHGAARPVLAAPARWGRIRRLVAAYDGSRWARKAVRLASVLSKASGLRLEVVHVSEDPEAGRRTLEGAERLLGRGAKVRAVRGAPRAALGRLARTPGSLLLIGTYGHGAFRELVLGSTVNYVLQAARVPVLVAR